MRPFKQTAVNCKIKLSNWLTGRYETLLTQPKTQPNPEQTTPASAPAPAQAHHSECLANSWRKRERERERLPHLCRDEHCSKWQWAHVSRKSVPQDATHTYAPSLFLTLSSFSIFFCLICALPTAVNYKQTHFNFHKNNQNMCQNTKQKCGAQNAQHIPCKRVSSLKFGKFKVQCIILNILKFHGANMLMLAIKQVTKLSLQNLLT